MSPGEQDRHRIASTVPDVRGALSASITASARATREARADHRGRFGADRRPAHRLDAGGEVPHRGGDRRRRDGVGLRGQASNRSTPGRTGGR